MASRPPIPGNPIPPAPAPMPGLASPGAAGPTAGGAPSEPGDLTDAHLRLDEHERRLGELERNVHPDHVGSVVHGAVAGLHASIQSELAKVLKAQLKDIETDAAVVAAIKELVAAIHALIATHKV